jgi:hypothetical protein
MLGGQGSCTSLLQVSGEALASFETITCPDQGEREFSIEIRPLDKEKLYHLEISAWPKGTDGKSSYAPVVIDELQGGHTYFGEKQANSADQIGELLVARIDLPLGTGHVYRHELDRPQKRPDLLRTLDRKTGCSDKNQDEPQFVHRTEILRLTGLATRGFATGQTTSDIQEEDVTHLEFQKTLQESDVWEWNFRYLNDSHTMRIRPGGTFAKMGIKSNQIDYLDRRNFDQGLPDLNIDAKQPLTFRWNPQNVTNTGYVTIQIGHSSLSSTTFCTYQASAGSATIDSIILQKLPIGSHVVKVSLEDQRFELGDDRGQPAWFITTSDWRAFRMEKL